MNRYEEALQVMEERFGCDSLISVATVSDNRPHVRTVDAYYEDGAFYIVTYVLSSKMKQIEANPEVAVCGEWFTAHGTGENLSHVLAESNAEMMAKLRKVFEGWYSGGHVNEDDSNTCLLCIHLADGVLFNQGTKYEINFVNQSLGSSIMLLLEPSLLPSPIGKDEVHSPNLGRSSTEDFCKPAWLLALRVCSWVR